MGYNHGIIPACAGNTGVAGFTKARNRDHPRMCGEHPTNADDTKVNPGSSPHVRGTQHENSVLDRVLGIIPACAGNTVFQKASETMVWDHPRMCGEHFCMRRRTPLQMGSSPHVRGTRFPDKAGE